jgi:hypothetical protein
MSGVANPDGSRSLNPKANATRAEATAMVWNLVDGVLSAASSDPLSVVYPPDGQEDRQQDPTTSLADDPITAPLSQDQGNTSSEEDILGGEAWE